MADRRVDMGWLRVFDAIGRLGSLTRAADELGLSQPAISYQIRRLEQQVRGAAAAPPASRCPAHGCRRGAASGSRRRCGPDRRGDPGHQAAGSRAAVRIFTDYGFAALWLMPRVADFRKANPASRCMWWTSQDLTGATSDIADLSSSSAIATTCRRERGCSCRRVVPVCAPGFAERLKTPVAVEDLARQPLLHLETVGKPRWFHLGDMAADAGRGARTAVGDLGLNSYGFVVQAAVAEQGLALGWIGLIDDNLANGSLTRVGTEVRRDGVGYWLTVSPQAHPRQPRAARLAVLRHGRILRVESAPTLALAGRSGKRPASREPPEAQMSHSVSPLAPKEHAPLPAIEGVGIATAEAGIKYKGRTDLLVMTFAEGTESPACSRARSVLRHRSISAADRT